MAATLYDELGVSRTADADEIRRAWRKAARERHPDRNPGDAKAAERFRLAHEAYEILRDPDRRRVYDATILPPKRRAPREAPADTPWEPVWPDPIPRRTRPRRHGKPLRPDEYPSQRDVENLRRSRAPAGGDPAESLWIDVAMVLPLLPLAFLFGVGVPPLGLGLPFLLLARRDLHDNPRWLVGAFSLFTGGLYGILGR